MGFNITLFTVKCKKKISFLQEKYQISPRGFFSAEKSSHFFVFRDLIFCVSGVYYTITNSTTGRQHDERQFF